MKEMLKSKLKNQPNKEEILMRKIECKILGPILQSALK